MEKIALVCMAVVCLCLGSLHAVPAASDPNDMEGSKDPALFNRMPGFYIYNFQELDFDRVEFPVGPDGKNEAVEGRYYYVDYYITEGAKTPSALQIVRNFSNAIKSIGGEVVYEFEDGGSQYLTLRVTKDNVKAWAHIEAASNGHYLLKIVEEQQMNQEVTANAESLAGSINATGKAAVYGIYFDTGKADLKPESEPALAEIVKMLKADAKLKLYVVGHTDCDGSLESNMKLSEARAAAVVKNLSGGNGIDAGRLRPFGVGPLSPVASNSTEDGKAKNRRVELVAQ